jgi:hypothetical protein
MTKMQSLLPRIDRIQRIYPLNTLLERESSLELFLSRGVYRNCIHSIQSIHPFWGAE